MFPRLILGRFDSDCLAMALSPGRPGTRLSRSCWCWACLCWCCAIAGFVYPPGGAGLIGGSCSSGAMDCCGVYALAAVSNDACCIMLGGGNNEALYGLLLDGYNSCLGGR